MSDRVKPPITELGGLLSALYREYGSRKTVGFIKVAGDVLQVEEHFDSGAGHSSAFSSQVSPLDRAVFDEALSKGFIRGKLMPGYVSKDEFLLTDRQDLLEVVYPIMKAWEKKEWARKRKEYLLKHIPDGFQGIHFASAMEDLIAGKDDHQAEFSLAYFWARWNQPTGTRKTLIEKITTPAEKEYGDNPQAEHLPWGDGEWAMANVLLASLVQWLGTEEGKQFYQEAMLHGGTRVRFEKVE